MAKERVGEETCRASIRGDRPVSSVECCSMFAYKAVFIDKSRVSRGKYGGLLSLMGSQQILVHSHKLP